MYKNYENSKTAYVKYIKEHKARVIDAWNEIQIKCQNQPFVTDKYINWYISNLVNHHDDSKFDDIEFEPYRKYFYPTTEETDKEQIQKEYDEAWIHHYTNNPHHWEYWCMYDQDKERNSLSFIRQAYHVEMMCDWMAMSQFENNTVPDWYINNQNKIVMNDDDKQFTEMLIDILF